MCFSMSLTLRVKLFQKIKTYCRLDEHFFQILVIYHTEASQVRGFSEYFYFFQIYKINILNYSPIVKKEVRRLPPTVFKKPFFLYYNRLFLNRLTGCLEIVLFSVKNTTLYHLSGLYTYY